MEAVAKIQVRIPANETATTPHDVALLELAAENADLRLQLAEAQEQCIEMAVDAGNLQAEIEALQAEVARLRSLLKYSLRTSPHQSCRLGN